MRTHRVVLGFALVLAMASSVTAQTRQGLWGSVGLQFANFQADVSSNSLLLLNAGEEWNGAAELAVGWGLNQRWLVGVEVIILTGRLGRSIDVTPSQVSGVALFYPAGNFFIKGGMGGSFLEVELIEDIPPSLTAGTADPGRGFGFTTGAGYDIYLGKGISITPSAGFWYGQPGDVQLNGRTIISGWTQKAFEFTIAAKFN